MWRRKGDPETFPPGVYLMRMELGYFSELMSSDLIWKLGTEQDRQMELIPVTYSFFNPAMENYLPVSRSDLFTIGAKVHYLSK
ncbi:MAG: hypothetical protein ACJASM_000871 [Salibacteraceae bacterium]|jgi:hypothetical protein